MIEVQYLCSRSYFWGNDTFSLNNALNNTSIQLFELKLFKYLLFLYENLLTF